MRRCKSFMCLLVLAASVCRAQPPAAPVQDDRQTRAYLTANGLLQRGLFDEAATEYRRFLADNASHARAPNARYGLAVCLFRTGKSADALNELNALLPDLHFEFAAEVATMAGQCLAAAGKHEDAATAFARVVTNHADHDLSGDAHAGWVEALYRLKKHTDAVRQSDAMSKRWPDSPLLERVLYLAALSHIQLGDDAIAIQRLRQLLQRWPGGALAGQATLQLAQCEQRSKSPTDAIARYRAILADNSTSLRPAALFGLATTLLSAGKPREATPFLDELVNKHADHALASAARIERARLWLDAGKPDLAAALLKPIPADDVEWADDRAYWMARCRLRASDAVTAAERLRVALDEFPSSPLRPEMCYDRAVALITAGDDAGAMDALTVFTRDFASHAMMPDALHMLAAAAHRRRQFDECDAACARFLKQFPTHQLASTISFLVAESAFLAAKDEKAIAAFRAFLNAYPQDAQTALARHRLGLALQRKGQGAEAEVELTAALKQLPRSADSPALIRARRATLRALADLAFEQEKWSQAIALFTEFLGETVAERPSPTADGLDDAHLRLALAQSRDARHEQAVASFRQLLKSFPDSPHALHARFELGQCLLALGRNDEAEKTLQQVMQAADNERFAEHAARHLAALAMRRGDFGAAAAQYASAAGRTSDKSAAPVMLLEQGQALLAAASYAEAEAILSRAAENGTSAVAAAARAQLGVAQARQNNSDSALATFARLTSTDWVALPPAIRATARFERANCLRQKGKSAEAAAEWRAVYDDATAGLLRWHAAAELAAIHIDARRHKEAGALLRELRERWSADASRLPDDLRQAVLYRLAVCEMETGSTDSAVALFAEFLDANASGALAASAGYFRGDLLAKSGKHAEAIASLTAALKRNPPVELLAACLLRLGESQAVLQRWEKSERAFSDYLSKFADQPQWFQARFGQGWARENLGRADEAISAYQDVVDRHKGPTAARAQFQLGECLFAQGKYEDACRELLKVDILYAYPEWSAAALFEAGRCFEKLNKAAEARALYRQVSDKYKATRWADLADKRLTELAGTSLPGRN